MPALTPVVIKDAATIDHTFVPRNVTNGIASYSESTGIPIGDRKLTMSLSETANGRRKVIAKLTLPEVQDLTVNGVSRPTLVRAAYATVEISYDATSNVVERQNMRGLIHNLMTQDTFHDLNDDLESVY